MQILFVADGRSPTALQWIEYFVDRGHQVHLVSTFYCEPALRLASLNFVSAAFSRLKKSSRGGEPQGGIPTALRTRLRNWLGPATISAAGSRLGTIIDKFQPDIVHALRIPFEGMIAAAANPNVPLMMSSWGNDFTLHAKSNPLMAKATRKAMARADALHSDTERDLRLAARWGFAAGKPSIVMPGNGGVRRDVFYPANTKVTTPRVINPRGIRAYVRNDVFFETIPKVLTKFPETRFECPGMAGKSEAVGWVNKLNLGRSVDLLPTLNSQQLAERYRAAQAMVSPSLHDGTPNSLLEAMACGVFPVCGDLESIREWITDGENGLLVNPSDSAALAEAIITALSDTELRESAVQLNRKLIAEKADFGRNMQKAEAFYSSVNHVSV